MASKKMKFTALSKNPDAISSMVKSLEIFSNITEMIIWRMDEKSLRLIVDPLWRTGPLLTECEWLRSQLFDRYTFRGVSEEKNLIYLSMGCPPLREALATVSHSLNCFKIKLTRNKLKRPAIAVSGAYTYHNKQRVINFELDVDVISVEFWKQYEDPELEFQITMRLPSYERFIDIMEPFGPISKQIVFLSQFQPDQKIKLALVVSGPIAFQQELSDLEMPPDLECVPPPSENEAKTFTARIDATRLYELLEIFEPIRIEEVNCRISDEKAVAIYLFNEFILFRITFPHVST